MKDIHIVIPFSRLHLRETLVDAYRPLEVILHMIMFEDEATKFDEPWIFPAIIPMKNNDCGAFMRGTFKRNWWLENCADTIIDDDYYVSADDDDMYEPNVIDYIRKLNDDIVIISMKRGYQVPEGVGDLRRYQTFSLIANPESVATGKISSQQFFVKGRIYKNHPQNTESHDGDGEIVVHYKETGEQIRYEPGLYALFNFFEPGRWASKEGKLAIGVMVNDIQRLDMCLQKSEIDPLIACHTVKNPESATRGINLLLDIMESEGNEIGIIAHQDMYFRNGWIDKVRNQIGKLPKSWLVAGIIGKDLQGRICGKMHDMRIPIRFDTSEIHDFPHQASCFDECVIIFNLKSGFRFKSMEGFDLYGTLCVLQAWEMEKTAWIIDAFAEHYCMRPFSWKPDELFVENYKQLFEKYKGVERIDSTALGFQKDAKEFGNKRAFSTSAA